MPKSEIILQTHFSPDQALSFAKCNAVAFINEQLQEETHEETSWLQCFIFHKHFPVEFLNVSWQIVVRILVACGVGSACFAGDGVTTEMNFSWKSKSIFLKSKYHTLSVKETQV